MKAIVVLIVLACTTNAVAGECKSDPKLVGACFVVHGRMFNTNGGATGKIWRIGTKRVMAITDHEPNKRYTKRELIGILGPNYRDAHYSPDDCLGEGDSAPLYEDPNGYMEWIEYRDRGIAVAVDQDSVNFIAFVAKPLGTRHSRCKQGSKRK